MTMGRTEKQSIVKKKSKEQHYKQLQLQRTNRKRNLRKNEWRATCLPGGGVTLPAFLTGPPFVAEGNGFDKRIEGNLAMCAKPLNKPFVNQATASQQRATVASQSKSGWGWHGEGMQTCKMRKLGEACLLWDLLCLQNTVCDRFL